MNESVGGVVEGLACRKASPGPEEKDLAQMQAEMLTLSGPCGSSSAPPPSYFPSPQVAFAWHHSQTMSPIPMWIWAVTISSRPPPSPPLNCTAPQTHTFLFLPLFFYHQSPPFFFFFNLQKGIVWVRAWSKNCCPPTTGLSVNSIRPP